MPYQVERYDGRWNGIRDEEGYLLYLANRKTRQIFRIEDGYVSGPAHVFLGQNVTGQFKEGERSALCNGEKRSNSGLEGRSLEAKKEPATGELVAEVARLV